MRKPTKLQLKKTALVALCVASAIIWIQDAQKDND